MPLKIRCPHCLRTLIAEDDTAGEGRRCPACGMGFTVPVPVPKDQGQLDIAGKCPRCKCDIAPGTKLCQSCLTNLVTGELLPRSERWAIRAKQRWVALTVSAVASIVLVIVAVQLYQIRQARLAREEHEFERAALAAEQAAASQPAPVGVAASQRLITAGNAGERARAIAEIQSLGPEALTSLTLAWVDAKADGANEQIVFNQVATARLLEDAIANGVALPPIVTSDAPGLLRAWRRNPAAQLAVDRVLARLGDSAARANLERAWLDATRRKLFFARLAALTPSPDNEEVARRFGAEADALGACIEGLPSTDRVDTLSNLLMRYWNSWSWLGQQRGEVYLVELFETAKPPFRQNQDFKERIRAARRLLDEVSQKAPISAVAAAGIAIQQVTPQYESLQDRVSQRLCSRLSDGDAPEQQRAVWALAALNGVSFGEFSPDKHPYAVGSAEVGAAGVWAHRRDDTVVAARVLSSYPSAPQLRRRLITPRTQLERGLALEMQKSFDAAENAVDRWLSSGLGFTPRMESFCNPGQRAPSLTALAPAMLIAAATNTQDLRPKLELWRQALDQPAWVRGFATTTIAILDARRGAASNNWPSDLEPEMLPGAESGPAWTLWGRLLSEGGAEFVNRLRKSAGPLPNELRNRLITEAEAAAMRRSSAFSKKGNPP